jgi:hypothetical protein
MKYLTPLKSIRKKCLECLHSYKAVKECREIDCPLWMYKDGHNMHREGIGNPNPDTEGLKGYRSRLHKRNSSILLHKEAKF